MFTEFEQRLRRELRSDFDSLRSLPVPIRPRYDTDTCRRAKRLLTAARLLGRSRRAVLIAAPLFVGVSTAAAAVATGTDPAALAGGLATHASACEFRLAGADHGIEACVSGLTGPKPPPVSHVPEATLSAAAPERPPRSTLSVAAAVTEGNPLTVVDEQRLASAVPRPVSTSVPPPVTLSQAKPTPRRTPDRQPALTAAAPTGAADQPEEDTHAAPQDSAPGPSGQDAPA